MTVLQFPTRFPAHVLDRFFARERSIAEIERDRDAVRAVVTEEPDGIREPDFRRIRVSDLISMFDVYDGVFFDGQIRTALAGRPLAFGLSRRATSRGGSLRRLHARVPEPGAPPEWFEMTISTSLLFDNFGANGRPVSIGGHECVDRLDALQRIVEHEIVHLLEHLRWGDSSCAGARFRWLVRAVFGHTEARHELVTPRERAAEQGLVPGRRVAFVFEGTRYEGIVNRVTKRATVLVPHPSGVKMSDGRCYLRFYVPLAKLTPISDGSAPPPVDRGPSCPDLANGAPTGSPEGTDGSPRGDREGACDTRRPG